MAGKELNKYSGFSRMEPYWWHLITTENKFNLSLRFFIYGKQPSFISHFVVHLKSSYEFFVGLRDELNFSGLSLYVFLRFLWWTSKIITKKNLVRRWCRFTKLWKLYKTSTALWWEGRLQYMKDVWSKEWNEKLYRGVRWCCYLQR